MSQVFWAIGTTKGGAQLQPFRSAGRATVLTSDPTLKLQHGIEAFVTVSVKNLAGLTSLRHSGAITVDHTPPVGVLLDGPGKADVDGFSSTVVSANFAPVVDEESGVASCSWAVGTAPHKADLADWAVADLSEGTVVKSGKLAGAKDGMVAYTSARCTNRAGLAATFSTDGAYFELTEPSARGALVEVISPPAVHASPFPSANGHQTVADTVQFRWEGFAIDQREVGSYEARVVGPGVSTPWKNTKLRQQVEFSGLALKENTAYKAQVVLTNAAGEKTKPIEAGVWVDTTPPKLTGVRMCANWTDAGLYIGWAASFAEVCVQKQKTNGKGPPCRAAEFRYAARALACYWCGFAMCACCAVRTQALPYGPCVQWRPRTTPETTETVLTVVFVGVRVCRAGRVRQSGERGRGGHVQYGRALPPVPLQCRHGPRHGQLPQTFAHPVLHPMQASVRASGRACFAATTPHVARSR